MILTISATVLLIGILCVVIAVTTHIEQWGVFGVMCILASLAFGFMMAANLIEVDEKTIELPKESIEVIKSEHVVMVIRNGTDITEFKTAKAYNEITDTTVFYYSEYYSSYGSKIRTEITY